MQNTMKKFFSLSMLLVLMTFVTGCVSRIGDFTVGSSKNIDIKKSLHVVDTKHRVRGVDKRHIIILFPTKIINMKEAIDNAEEKAPACVGLSDVTIKYGGWYIPYIYGQEWYEVEGNPVFEAADGIPDYDPNPESKQKKRSARPRNLH